MSTTTTIFNVCDTRRITQPITSIRKPSWLKDRLYKSLDRSKLMFREDIDMPAQVTAMQLHKQQQHIHWMHTMSTKLGFTCQDQVISLKMLITEAERYQAERNLPFLKSNVLARALASLGSKCPKTIRVSTVVIKDIDIIMALPAESLPATPHQLAAKAVLALPLWRPARAPATRSPESPSVTAPKAKVRKVHPVRLVPGQLI